MFYHRRRWNEQRPYRWVEAFGLFVFVVLTELCIFLNRPSLLWLWLPVLEAVVLVVLPVELTLILECLAHGRFPLMVLGMVEYITV